MAPMGVRRHLELLLRREMGRIGRLARVQLQPSYAEFHRNEFNEFSVNRVAPDIRAQEPYRNRVGPADNSVKGAEQGADLGGSLVQFLRNQQLVRSIVFSGNEFVDASLSLPIQQDDAEHDGPRQPPASPSRRRNGHPQLRRGATFRFTLPIEYTSRSASTPVA